MFNRDNDDSVGWVNDHLFVNRVSNMIELECDDYRPSDHDWDVEEWEARKGFISVPVSRSGWMFAYRLARALVRHGKTTVLPQGVDVTLPCEVSVILA